MGASFCLDRIYLASPELDLVTVKYFYTSSIVSIFSSLAHTAIRSRMMNPSIAFVVYWIGAHWKWLNNSTRNGLSGRCSPIWIAEARKTIASGSIAFPSDGESCQISTPLLSLGVLSHSTKRYARFFIPRVGNTPSSLIQTPTS